MHYSIKTSVTGAGSVVLSSNQTTFPAGTIITATAVSSNRFLGWQGYIQSTSNVLTITLDSDLDLLAHFEANPGDRWLELKATGTLKLEHLSSDGDLLFYPDSQGNLSTFHLSTGARGWTFSNRFDPPAVISGDRVYVRSSNRLLQLDKRNGRILRMEMLVTNISDLLVLPTGVYCLSGGSLVQLSRTQSSIQTTNFGYSNATLFAPMSHRLGVLNEGQIHLHNLTNLRREFTIPARGPIQSFFADHSDRIFVHDGTSLMSFEGRTGIEQWRTTNSLGSGVNMSRVGDSIVVLHQQQATSTVSAFSIYNGALQWSHNGAYGSKILQVLTTNKFLTDAGLEITVAGTNLVSRRLLPGSQGSVEMFAIGDSYFALQPFSPNTNSLRLIYAGEAAPYRVGWYTARGNMERQGRPELGILGVERRGAELIAEVPTVLGSVLWLERTESLTNVWMSSAAIRGTGQVERVTLPTTNSSGLFRLRLDRQ
jgi:outer membrane protein assembly factor BamB